ncbi:MAG: anti-sigma factor antagonist [Clostridia bacterium]|nr:anti-sigma factor antagonist [Clostridia bacterium]
METSIIAKHRMVLMRVSGEIDHHSADYIRRCLEREIKRTGAVNIALDFSRVSFMDSSGIGMIIGRYKTVSALGGAIIIFDASEQIKRLMEMSGLNSLVIVSDTLQKGISQMNKTRGVRV